MRRWLVIFRWRCDWFRTWYLLVWQSPVLSLRGMCMRWSFLLLLVLNLFYYVWHQQQAPLRVKEVTPLSMHQGVRQDIRLLSESGGVQPRRDHSADALSGASEVCMFLGGFDQEEQAKVVEQR